MTTDATSNPASPIQPATRAVALLGLDHRNKPHGAAFGVDQADLARKAAELAGLHVLELAGHDGLTELAGKLPAGRIFASGAAFTPFVARRLFDEICAAGGLTADHLAELRATSAAARSTKVKTPALEHHLPVDRDAIAIGSIVLAADGDAPGRGWFEAVVTGHAEADGVLVLGWRDYPDYGPFARHRDQLALLPRNPAALT